MSYSRAQGVDRVVVNDWRSGSLNFVIDCGFAIANGKDTVCELSSLPRIPGGKSWRRRRMLIVSGRMWVCCQSRDRLREALTICQSLAKVSTETKENTSKGSIVLAKVLKRSVDCLEYLHDRKYQFRISTYYVSLSPFNEYWELGPSDFLRSVPSLSPLDAVCEATATNGKANSEKVPGWLDWAG